MKLLYKIGIGAGLGIGLYFIYKAMTGKRMSLKGIDFLIQREGFKNKAYKDSKGYWTIGVGHKIMLPQENDLLTKVLTNFEVRELLKKDIKRFENAVNSSILLPINQNQFDALVSLAFNIGENGFKGSTLAKRINLKSNVNDLINGFMMWNSGGLLLSRRALEARLYTTGNYNNLLSPSDLLTYTNLV